MAVTALLIASCSGNKQSFTLTGKFKGLQSGEFLCFSRSPGWGSLDTIKVVDGEFAFTRSLTDTSIIVLQYPNFMQTQIIAVPGAKTMLRGDANNMKRISVRGDTENEELSDFNDRTANMKEAQAKKEAEEFIRHNPHLWASIALLDKFFLQAESPDLDRINRLLGLMLKVRPNRSYIRLIENEIMPLLKCRTDTKLPSFKTNTIEGKVICDTVFKGKALLITFWSTMDNEFRFPLVCQRNLMHRMSDRVAQLNICLDADTSSCMHILRRDTIGGYNVCDGKAFGSPLVKLFGLRRLPANILIDKNGVVKARDIAPDDLETEFHKIGIE